MKVKNKTITLELEHKDASAINTVMEMLSYIYGVMVESETNALFDGEGLLLSKDNVAELREILGRLWVYPTVEICYSEHVKAVDET